MEQQSCDNSGMQIPTSSMKKLEKLILKNDMKVPDG